MPAPACSFVIHTQLLLMQARGPHPRHLFNSSHRHLNLILSSNSHPATNSHPSTHLPLYPSIFSLQLFSFPPYLPNHPSKVR
ncbi:hypothetical protein EV126DRAFT_459830 [Verticillium dahliae]|nr:hypothetical protein EV126DRAFT_459830 [Verticillium dahliae]